MKKLIALLAVLLCQGLVSCSLVGNISSQSEPTTTPEIFMPLPPDQRAFEAVREFLGQELGVDPLTISLVDIEAVQWPDSCLGLPGPDEACSQVVTDGFRVRLKVGEAIYEFHTDQNASQIRQVR
jgi:hypothetical protein